MSLTLRSAFVLVLATALFPGSRPPAAADDDKLVAIQPRSRHTIAQAVRQAEYPCPHEPVISAGFERNDDGKLSLSLASAEKGLNVAAEHNVLMELVASPESERWTPVVEVFKDVEHVSRAATELTPAALSKFTLLEVLERAEEGRAGNRLCDHAGRTRAPCTLGRARVDEGRRREPPLRPPERRPHQDSVTARRVSAAHGSRRPSSAARRRAEGFA